MTDDPRLLLQRCLASREAGDWQTFIDRHGGEVRRAVYQAAVRAYLPVTSQDLDEMVQDLYCRLLSIRRQSYAGRTENELWHYVHRVAHSLVVDRHRLQGARKRQPRPRSGAADPSSVPSPRLDPEQRLLKKERRKLFFERCYEVVCCDRMGLELKALALALLEGWSSRDIARELRGGLSAGRVDRLVYRLRRLLARDGIRMPRRYCLSVPAPAGA